MTHTTTTTTTTTIRLATHHHHHHHHHHHVITARRFLTTHIRYRPSESTFNLQAPPPSIPTCPPLPSEYSCSDMPPGLDIEREKPLKGTMPPYARHVLVRTGRHDWWRRIEDEEGGNFARSLKGLVGPGGKFYNPERPILITNSSQPVAMHGSEYASVSIFPTQVRVPKIPHKPEMLETFVSQFLLGKKAYASWHTARKAARGLEARSGENGVPILEEDIQARAPKLKYTQSTSPTILICGHSTRDTRCGILGPILHGEFNSYLEGPLQRWLDRVRQPGSASEPFQPLKEIRFSTVALTSHVGGHAFAGNVIIYLPHTLMMLDGKRSPLAGLGIWYGRVEPRHVWGIMEETVLRGNIIEELLRGVHKSGEMDG